MIEFRTVTKQYGDLTAVDEVSFTVPEGQVCVLIGPSGCGKTTTLRLINRMLEPTSGEVLLRGREVHNFQVEELRRGIGYVIQDIGLFPHMSVSGNIGVVPRLLGWDKPARGKRADELLDMVGLNPDTYRDKYPHQLSGGEAQRIGVARALAADPPVLLMDEPFGAVDPLNREVLQGEFINIQRELRKTVVFVTHDLDEAIRLADVIVLMREGKIVQMDSADNILAFPKNRFVRDFVGTDRALKRLSRFKVEDNMREPVRMTVGNTVSNGHLEGNPEVRFLWVVDDQGYLKGWVDRKKASEGMLAEDVMTSVRPVDIGVSRFSSLKEALSRMLGQGVKVVPVLDKEWHLVGEIGLRDIEAVTEAGDFSW
jgi:osmoprotectant transport system ATP-binding protein